MRWTGDFPSEEENPNRQAREMNSLHYSEKGPGFMPTQGRCCRQVHDQKLKVKARRQERRKTREAIRMWMGDSGLD